MHTQLTVPLPLKKFFMNAANYSVIPTIVFFNDRLKN
jgi:hypothetical protein